MRPSRVRGLRALAGLAALAFALSACSGADTSEPPTDDGAPKVLRVAQRIAEPASMDPHGPLSLVSAFQAEYEALVRLDEHDELVGLIAQSWENVDDLTWQFDIRPGLTFHNGEPLTASDVKFTIDRLLTTEPALNSKRFIGNVESAEVVDDTTLLVRTKAPDAILPYAFLAPVYVIPEDYFTEVGQEGFAKEPVGSGPFKFVSWESGVAITLEAWDDYWQGRAKIDQVQFIPIEEDATRLAALQSGDIDVADLMRPQDVEMLENDERLDVVIVQGGPPVFLGFNTLEPPFDDVRVRQAVNYAIDADEIIDTVMSGYGERALIGPQRAPGAVPLDVVGHYPHKLDEAKRLLAEAGYPDGFATDCGSFQSGNYQEILQAVAVQLAKVGITCDVQVNEVVATWFPRWLDREIKGIFLIANDRATESVDAGMGSYFDSRRRSPYYDNPELNALLDQARGEFDDDQRDALYTQIAQLFHDDAPAATLYLRPEITAYSSHVKNLPPVLQYVYVYDVELD